MILASLAQYALSLGASTTNVIYALARDFAANGMIVGGKLIELEDGSSIKLSVFKLLKAIEDYIENSNNPGFSDASNPLQSSSAFLSKITIPNHVLTPEFDPEILEYSVNVPYDVTTIQPELVLNDSEATVTLNKNAPGKPIELNVGENTINVEVKSADSKRSRTYKIIANRAGQSVDASLSALAISAGALSPEFQPSTYAYALSVQSSVTALTVTPTKNDPNSSISVRINGGNYAPVVSASASNALPLNFGINTIEILVTAQDVSVARTYTVVVTRPYSTNAKLSALTLSNGTLSPAFSPVEFSYTASVANSVTSITLVPTSDNTEASIEAGISGGALTAVNSGVASSSIALNVGTNVIEINSHPRGARAISDVRGARAGIICSFRTAFFMLKTLGQEKRSEFFWAGLQGPIGSRGASS